jgi:DNA repair protein RecO (recombination protein O)
MTRPERERSFRTPALILKRRDFGEADRMLTILTPDDGKLDVLAKGARKLTSRKTGHVELFTRADLLVSRGRDFGQVTQAEMTAPYLTLREDLTRGAYATYVVELLDRFTTESEDHDGGRLFALLDATFARVSDAADPRLAVRYYELQLLDRVGFRPELHECVIGRESIQPEDQYFSVSEGGAVCPTCAARGRATLLAITLGGLKVLRHLQRSSYDVVAALHLAPALHDEIERIMLAYITHVLERRVQSIEFVQRVRGRVP